MQGYAFQRLLVPGFRADIPGSKARRVPSHYENYTCPCLVVNDENGNTAVRLKTDARQGLLSELGRCAHEAGWTVIELTHEHHDLEDIFRELKAEKEEAA